VWCWGAAASVWRGESVGGAGCYVFDPHGERVPTADDTTFDLDLARSAGLLVDPLERALAIDTVEVIPADGS